MLIWNFFIFELRDNDLTYDVYVQNLIRLEEEALKIEAWSGFETITSAALV